MIKEMAVDFEKNQGIINYFHPGRRSEEEGGLQVHWCLSEKTSLEMLH